MKLIKALLLLILISITGNMYAQTVKTVDATILKDTAFNSDESPDHMKYLLLIEDLTEGTKILEDLNEEDVKIMKEYDSYYPVGYNEFAAEESWSIIGSGCSWYCGGRYITSASSSLAAQGKNVYTNESIDDDDVRTAWVEGVKGYGIGEYIEFTFDYDAPRATKVTISNGYNKDATTWRNNSRVKTLNIYENDILLMIVNLADTRDLQTFDLPHPIPNRNEDSDPSQHENDNPPVHLKMMINEVYEGDKYDDTAISEISFEGLDVHCLIEGTMITMANKKEQAIETMQAGQEVLVWNPVKKKMEKQRVVRVHSARHSASEIISINYRLNQKLKLILTADHPLYSSAGWVSANPAATANYQRYVDATIRNLESYAILYRLSANKKKMIKKKIDIVEYFDSTNQSMFNTYTLELDGNGVFFADGFAVGQE